MQNDEGKITYPHQIMALVILTVFLALNCYRFCFSLNNETQIENLSPCLLEVKGEVPHPGLYYYAYCPTINELLNASGQAPDEKVTINQNSMVMLSTGTSLWVQKTRKGVTGRPFPLGRKKENAFGNPHKFKYRYLG